MDRNVVLFINQPIYDWSQLYPAEPDNSLELIREHFPEVEIFSTDANHYGAPIINEGLRFLSDCDVVIHLHADVVMSPSEYSKLYDYLQSTNFDVYKMDMKKTHIDYYYDFEHGTRDCIDVEPVACKSTNEYSHYWNTSGTIDIIDFVTCHHFNGWKGVTATKEWVENKVPTESNVYARQLAPFTPCPEEIRNLFK